MKYDNTDSYSTLKHICNIQTKLYNTNWAVEQPGQINHETMRVLSSIRIMPKTQIHLKLISMLLVNISSDLCWTIWSSTMKPPQSKTLSLPCLDFSEILSRLSFGSGDMARTGGKLDRSGSTNSIGPVIVQEIM